MLQRLRENSNKWFIKLLFVAIVVSFAFFGIGDIIRSYFVNRPIIKVGSMGLNTEGFIQKIKELTVRKQNQFQGKISEEDIKKMNLPQKVINRFVERAVIEHEIDRFNLDISETTIKNYIQSIPAFQKDGIFNYDLFKQILKNAHKTEIQFINDLRQDLISQQFIGSFLNGATLPKFYSEKLVNSVYQNFVFTAVFIKNKAMKITHDPKEEDLKFLYTKKMEKFKIPEYRLAKVLIIDRKIILQNVEIPLTDLKAEYDQRRSEFTIPERRLLTKLVLPTRKLAEDAIIKIKDGRPAKAVARDLKAQEILEELVEKSDLPEEIGKDIFSLKENEVSKPYDRGLGFSVYVISKIEKEEVKTFEKVKEQIEDGLKMQKMGDYLRDLQNRIEDSVASGQSFEEIAKNEKIDIVQLEAFDKQGLNKKREELNIPAFIKKAKKIIVDNAFDLQPLQESSLVDIDGNVSIIVRLEHVDNEQNPSFETVREDVKQYWFEEQQRKESLNIATSIYKEAKNITLLGGLAAQNKLEIMSHLQLSRIVFEKLLRSEFDQKYDSLKDKSYESLKKIGVQALERVLVLKKNQPSIAQNKDGYVIFMLEEIKSGSPEAKEKKQFESFFNREFQEDILDLLVQGLKVRYPLTINEEMMKKLNLNNE